MRVRYAEATGCPHGQFVIEVDSETESAIIAAFTGAPLDKWEFCMHGTTYKDGHSRSFNFGWRPK